MSFRFRLYPTNDQEGVLSMHCGHARFVWNMALEHNGFAKTFGSYPDQYDWFKLLTEARKDSWLGDGSTMIQQQALRDLRQAFTNFWSNPGHYGYPKWRSKNRGSNGFRVVNLHVRRLNRKWWEVRVPKAGWVKFKASRSFPKDVKSARFTLDRSGRWHISLASPQPVLDRESTGRYVGVDFGVASTVTTSDGEHLRLPRLLSDGEAARKLGLQRKLSRQQKGSNRRERTRLKLAKMCAKEVDRRKDWIEKTTTDLVRNHDLIVVEDLKISNMTRSAKGTVENPGRNVKQKSGLNRSIMQQSWGLFTQRLIDKAGTTETCEIVKVNPAYTSQTCSRCGTIDSGSRESQSVFKCVACEFSVNADVNASINILAAGYAVSGRGENVRPLGADFCEASTLTEPIKSAQGYQIESPSQVFSAAPTI